jgi:hypothetical protein
LLLKKKCRTKEKCPSGESQKTADKRGNKIDSYGSERKNPRKMIVNEESQKAADDSAKDVCGIFYVKKEKKNQ